MESIGKIIASVFWLICRWLRIYDANKPQRLKDENAKIIATHDVDALNRKLNDKL